MEDEERKLGIESEELAIKGWFKFTRGRGTIRKGDEERKLGIESEELAIKGWSEFTRGRGTIRKRRNEYGLRKAKENFTREQLKNLNSSKPLHV